MDKNLILMITEKVNYEALENARRRIPEYRDSDSTDIVRDVIEKHLIYREIASDEDLKDAIELEKELGFDDLADWVSYTLRKVTEPYMETCRNCMYFQESEYFCTREGFKVNPNFCRKPCFVKKAN